MSFLPLMLFVEILNSVKAKLGSMKENQYSLVLGLDLTQEEIEGWSQS